MQDFEKIGSIHFCVVKHDNSLFCSCKFEQSYSKTSCHQVKNKHPQSTVRTYELVVFCFVGAIHELPVKKLPSYPNCHPESSVGTIQDLFKTRFRLGGRNDHFHDQSDSCEGRHRTCRESESNRMLVCSVLCYEHLVWNKRLNQF